MQNSFLLSLLLASMLFSLPATSSIDLSTTYGAKFTCATNDAFTGWALVSIGDINNDQINDFAIGAFAYNNDQGLVAIIFGSTSDIGTVELCPMTDFTKGYEITGKSSGSSQFGFALAAPGDINGDGVADLVVGAPGLNSYDGKVYVIYLPATPPTSSLSIDSHSDGYTLTGSSGSGEGLGYSLGIVGDVDNDGKNDILIGAPNADSNKGRAYVLYTTTTSSNPTTSTPNNNEFYYIYNGDASGMLGDFHGIPAKPCGDLNRDANSIDDILIGASLSEKVYIIFGTTGRTRSSVDLSVSSDVFTISSTSSQIGASVSCGDITGDGYKELLFGTSNKYESLNGNSMYVIYGDQVHSLIAAGSSYTGIDTITTPQGFIVTDSNTGKAFASSVSGDADIDGDEINDLLIGATYEQSNKGSVFVKYGASNDGLSAFEVNTMVGTSTSGFQITGPTSNYLGMVIGSLDINQDGVGDIIASGPNYSTNKGAVYVVYGTCSSSSAYMSNGLCCLTSKENSNGHCCPRGQTYDTTNKICHTSPSVSPIVSKSKITTLTGGQIVGIVLGCLCTFLALVVLGYVLMQRYRPDLIPGRRPKQLQHMAVPNSPSEINSNTI